MKLTTMIMFGAVALAGCKGAKAPVQTVIGQQQLTAEEAAAGLMTPEVMYKLGRVGGFDVAPDGTLAYAVSNYSVAENRRSSTLHVGETTLENASNPHYVVGELYFSRGGQVWRGQKQITHIEGGVESWGVAPTGDKLFYTQKVRTAKHESKDVHPDLPLSKALIYDDLMERHWDYWDRGDYSHIFIMPLDGSKPATDIMPGEQWDAPMAPYFDAAEISWSHDGRKLAYTCKKLTGKDYALSTDADIYIYDLESGTTQNLTEGMVGYDKYPVFSPDDTRIAWRSMARPGNESDKDRLFVMNVDGSDKQYLTENFDYNATNVARSGNDELIFRAPIEATHQLCSVPVAGGEVRVLTQGDHDLNDFVLCGDGTAIAGLTTLQRPTELFKVTLADGSMSAVTDVNGHIYDKIRVGRSEKRWVATSDGKQMLVWVTFPPDFDPAQKYPTLLYCQGGPQSVVSQAWSYRWNYQLMAARGYIVVAPNRRGLPSFGQEWLDQISGDYSGQNIRDYLAAIDNVSAEPWSDETRLGCVGASYGGYSSYYLAGTHQGRFKAFVAHCGMFDFVSKFGATEELFFPMHDLGGAYWDLNNAVAQRSYANSPHRLVQNWNTPILIITGLQDFRIPYTQSLEAFTAAQMLGVPSRLVAFENEAHQVFGAQNAIVWNREFFAWLDKYVKG